MMRWQHLAAVAVAVLAAGSTMAQGQRQQPGGRGGFGQQQPLHMLVLTNEDLQKDLKVTDDQKKGLKELTDKAAALAKKGLATGWKATTGRKPPENPADPDVDIAEAVAWALVSGMLIGVARMLAQRRAASYFVRSTGHLPGQLKHDGQ